MKCSFLMSLVLFAVSTFAQIPNKLTPEDKVYGLSKFWQEVNYNFVYLEKVDRNMWDGRYKELIKTEAGPVFYVDLPKGTYTIEEIVDGKSQIQTIAITKNNNQPSSMNYYWK